jgi:predicted Zn-ribbon and HTH transcriptional regulator
MNSDNVRFSAHCPHCKSIEFRSVGVRNTIEKIVFWILRPCRCGLCGRHFFLFRWQTSAMETS